MSDLSLLTKQAAVVAINKVLTAKRFDICTVREVAELLGGDTNCQEFSILRTIHCVEYKEMPPNMRESIPELIAICMKRPDVFQFAIPEAEETIIDVDFTVVPTSLARKIMNFLQFNK